MGIVGMTSITECCPHRAGRAVWIKNDGTGPPVLWWETFDDPAGPVTLTMTKQTIYVNCPQCFSAIRAAGSKETLAPS